MTSRPHGHYAQGYTRATVVYTRGGKVARVSQSHKVEVSSDRRRRLGSVKLGWRGMAEEHAAVNTCRGRVHSARDTM